MARLKTGLQEVWEFGALIGRHPRMQQVFVSAAASVAIDATLEEIIERKLMECVRGLREHASANLHDLMIGLVEKPLLRAVLRETGGNQVRSVQILGNDRNTLRKKLIEHGIDPDAVEG